MYTGVKVGDSYNCRIDDRMTHFKLSLISHGSDGHTVSLIDWTSGESLTNHPIVVKDSTNITVQEWQFISDGIEFKNSIKLPVQFHTPYDNLPKAELRSFIEAVVWAVNQQHTMKDVLSDWMVEHLDESDYDNSGINFK